MGVRALLKRLPHRRGIRTWNQWVEHFSELRVWTWNARADPSWLEHLRTHLSELTFYLDANADALPGSGARSESVRPFQPPSPNPP